jgi:hypothetical protein
MIDQKDVDSCEVVGKLNGEDVKLLKTKGGFHLFIGKKSNREKEVVLTGTSHKAIGMYKLQKEFNGFQPLLKKSEMDVLPRVNEIPNDSKYRLYEMESNGYKAISACHCGIEVMAVLLKKEEDGYSTHSINADFAKKMSKEEKNLLATVVAKALANVK